MVEKRNGEMEISKINTSTLTETSVVDKPGDVKLPFVSIETDTDDALFVYDVFENPNILMTLFFAMQQVLMSLSRSLSTSLLVADIVCARSDENYKARLLSTTLFISGLTTFLQNTIGIRVVATSMILSFYLRNCQSPNPAWTRGRGFHIKWYPAHKMFSVLLSCLIGWAVSAILTVSGALSNDPDSIEYYARTDSRIEVIEETDWFIFPYPGQFGSPGFDTGAFIAFIMGTISSVIDSIGDYYACSKMCNAPPPPSHAVNRGIAVEGFMSFLGGWSGAGHATSTFGGNIGAIGITRVASLRVFQVVGIIFMVFGVVGKIGAIFVTIPYSVVGGMMMINFGVVIGVMLSNLQFIDLSSTRNMAIIGMSMLIALMTPHWIETTPKAIDTGIPKLDSVFKMLLANPSFVAGVLACFMDNTIPGTLKERGMLAWHAEMGRHKDDEAGKAASKREMERNENLLQTIYTVPFAKQMLKRFPFLAFIPIFPK